MSNTCPHCRHANPERAMFCGACGKVIAAGQSSQAAPPVPQLSLLALLSLIFSLVPFLLLPQIAALVMSLVALRRIKRSGGALYGRGFAIAGLCISTALLSCVGCLGGFGLTMYWLEERGVIGEGHALVAVDRFSASPDEVRYVEISPARDRLLALAGGDFHLWDAATAAKICQRPLVGTVAGFSRDGKHVIAVRGNEPPIFVRFDSQTGQPQFSHNEDADAAADSPALALTLSGGDPRLVGGFKEGTAWVWDFESGRQVAQFSLPKPADSDGESISDMAVSLDGQRVLLACHSSRLYFGNIPSGSVSIVREKSPPVYRPRLFPDGRHVLAYYDYYSSSGRVIDLESAPDDDMAEAVGEDAAPRHRWGMSSLNFSADGKFGVSGGRTAGDANYIVFGGSPADYGREVFAWKVDSPQAASAFYDHGSRVTSVAFSPDARRILAGYADGTVILLDWKRW
jgi:WD40 repeat protein